MFTLQKRLARLRESGQGTIEYLGIAVCISVLIASLSVSMTPVGQNLGSSIQKVICQIASPVTGANCGDPENYDPEEYMVNCPVIGDSQQRGSAFDVAFVSLGGGMTLKVVKMSDGTAQVSLIGDVSAGAKYELAKAKLNDWVELNAGVGIDITGSMGDTWQFDSWEDAEAFAQNNKERVDSGWNYVPVLGPIINKQNAPADPRSSTYAINVEGWAKGEGGIGIPTGKGDNSNGKSGKNSNANSDGSNESSSKSGSTNTTSGDGSEAKSDSKTDLKVQDNLNELSGLNDLLPQAGINIDASAQGALTYDRGENLDDPSDDTRTFTFDVGAGGNADGKGLGFNAGGNTGIKTSFSYKLDAQGNVIGLTIAQSHEMGGGTGDKSDDNTSTVYKAELDLTDPKNRQIVADFMQNPGGIPDLEKVATSGLGPQTPEQQALVDLMQTPAFKLNKMTMKNINESDGISLGVKVSGLGLAYENSDSSTHTELEDAQTLVPNGQGGFEWVTNTKCV